jgi:hypothetical protein
LPPKTARVPGATRKEISLGIIQESSPETPESLESARFWMPENEKTQHLCNSRASARVDAQEKYGRRRAYIVIFQRVINGCVPKPKHIVKYIFDPIS